MNTGRDRASGWQHAKLSGHENEADVEQLFKNEEFRKSFSQRLGIGNIMSASVGGLKETNVESVLGDTTKSKTDLTITLEDGKKVNISIKKSWGGQVYLIGVERFIDGYEKQFGEAIPNEIRELLFLYFYGSPKTNELLTNPKVIANQSKSLVLYQKYHNRLVWESLSNWDNKAADSLLEWFKNSIDKIAEYCFSRGLASNKEDWADYVWYINLLGEDNMDYIFSIEEIKKTVKKCPELVYPSSRNGGSTIQLPFGFVQWHQKQMQFHHRLEKLYEIIDS